jgi:hypothetical protein
LYTPGPRRQVDLTKDFRTYGIYKGPGLVVILIDNQVFGTYLVSAMPLGAKWVFDAPM